MIRIAGRLDDRRLRSNMFDISPPTCRPAKSWRDCQSSSGYGPPWVLSVFTVFCLFHEMLCMESLIVAECDSLL